VTRAALSRPARTALSVALVALASPAGATAGLSWSKPIRIDTIGKHTGLALAGVSCSSPALCVVVDLGGNVLTSTDPGAGSKARWVRRKLDRSHGAFLQGIACVASALCAAVDDKGHVFTSTDPSAGRSAAWVEQRPHTQPLYGIACASTSLCIAVDKPGRVIASTNPTAGRQARWSSAVAEPGAFSAAPSCPSVSLCLLANSFGNIVTSTDPGRPSAGWVPKNIDGDPFRGTGFPLSAVSCPSTVLCVAVDAGGNTLTSTDPADGPFARWRKTNVLGHFSHGYYSSFQAISCPATSLCVAVGDHGLVTKIVASTDPGADPQAHWRAHTLPSNPNHGIDRLSCASPTLCVAVGIDGDIIVGSSG
jgi:photosystem II stability/assembly factor-like uncharacterized protein